MPVTAFGPHAAAYAARLPAVDVLVFDESGFGDALTDAVERAYSALPFIIAPVLAHPHAAFARRATREIVTAHAAYWERRERLDRVRLREYVIDGKGQAEHEVLTKKERDSIADIALAADAIAVRSWSELARFAERYGVRPIRSVRVVAAPAFKIPRFEVRRGARTIVVWAPGLHAFEAAIFAVAFEELHAPVTIVCAAAEAAKTLGCRSQFIDPSDTTALTSVLADAAAIVDASADDPAGCIELASLGIPLAASFTSGSYEYVDGLHLYDSWDFRSILHAGLAALGGREPLVRANIPRAADLAATLATLAPPVVENPPLVSVVVPTRDRLGVLPRAVDSIVRQTYPNVELVVVNDGGKPVDAIVRRHPRVVLQQNEHGEGAHNAVNTGFALANGEYVVFLADDDYLFPSHISRLVYALERTGASVAAGLSAESYLQRGDDSAYDYIGTSIRLYRSTDPTVLRTVPMSMATSAMAVRRSAAVELAGFDSAANFYNDYEWDLRLIDRFDFLWVSHLVLNMDSRLDGSNLSTVTTDTRINVLEYVWSRHPADGRPDIERERKALIELYRNEAPSPQHPMHRGVTRISSPKRGVYRLDA